jgi:hypothetical protein
MPEWWTADKWQLQLPSDVYPECNVTISTVKKKFSPNDHIRYCPDWTGPKKAGRRKKDLWRKLLLEVAQGKGKQKYKRLFCSICGKFNHTKSNCFNGPMSNRFKNAEEEED